MATYTAVVNELKTILPEVLPIISTSTSSSETTYLADTLLIDPSGVHLTADEYNDGWIELPDTATAADRERRIGGNSGASLDRTNGYVYPVAAWSAAPDAVAYRIWCGIRPRDAFNLWTAVLQNLLIPDYGSFNRFTDEDCETSGVTNYTVSGAGAITKVTTAINVHSGVQSMFFNAATAGEYVESPSIRVIPDETYFGSCIARADAGTVSFAVWDKTNDAEIDSGNRLSHSLESFMSMQRTFSTPSTCEEISYRVYCTGSSDDIYIDRFHGPYKATDTLLNAPASLTRDVDFRKLLFARYATSYSSGIYDAGSRIYEPTGYIRDRDFYLRSAVGQANPVRVEFNVELPMQELWLETLRVASDFTTPAFTAAGESLTTNVDTRLCALYWAKSILENVSGNYDWVGMRMGKVQAELAPLMVDFVEDAETPTQPTPLPLRRFGGL